VVSTLEGEVQSLCWEVTDDVGSVTSPEGEDTFFGSGTTETLYDTVITFRQTSRLLRVRCMCDKWYTLIISS